MLDRTQQLGHNRAMSTFDTVIVRDRLTGHSYFGQDRAEVLHQFTTFLIARRPDGSHRVRVTVPGAASPIELGYLPDFTSEEVQREAARDALRRIARDYAFRYVVYLAETQ